MFRTQPGSFLAAFVAASIACLSGGGAALAADSGQRIYAQVVVEPAVDTATGNTVYLHMPANAPARADKTAPLYLPLYPLTSTVSAFELNCQPNNCEHVNVLPFHFSGYDALAGSSQACVDFNGGQECSLVKGHDHLVAVAAEGGDFHTAWHVQLVVFTAKAFTDGAIHTRIKTLSQLNALLANQDVIVMDTPITLLGSFTSRQTYELGSPVAIQFP